jgi:tetratricopeptide (TPR) repeat protein
MNGWGVARNSHFEVYSQAGREAAIATLTKFEELRSFFAANRMLPGEQGTNNRPPLRVVEFGSKKEYDAVKIRRNADAFYTGTSDRDYIVVPASGTHEFALAAHEYAHFMLHSRGLKLPSWLSEGLAELFSTLRITARGCELGGEIPERVATLRRHSWLPAAALLAGDADSLLGRDRNEAAMFYAQSWALADLLTSSRDYAPLFSRVVERLNAADSNSQQVLASVYGKPPDTILADTREWIGHGRSSRRILHSLTPQTPQFKANPIPAFQARSVIADLQFAEEKWDRVEQLDIELLQESPNDPETLASLGAIALQRGNRRKAIEYWRRALQTGMKDAALCYRYAVLADEMGLPSSDVDHALEEAISSQPDFDDARYKLALSKSNVGEFETALQLLQAMKPPSPQRAYGYWTAVAYALSELDKRDEAEDAAKKALKVAASAEERAKALQLAYVAKTDLTVQFSRDANGKSELTTTRIPHGTTEFNPFVETGDQIRTAVVKLREVQCREGKLTGFLVDSGAGALTLLVPDPTHVLLRNGPSEFYCGPQDAKGVKVEYAQTPKLNIGLLRGMEFQ